MMNTAHSPHTHRRPHMQSVTVWTTLFATPLIWLLHLRVCIALVSSACAGAVAHGDELPWGDVEYLIDAASAGAFVICLALAIATGRAWRRLVWLAQDRRPGTACFVAWCSLIVAVVFTGALAFTACVMIAAPIDRLCGPFQ